MKEGGGVSGTQHAWAVCSKGAEGARTTFPSAPPHPPPYTHKGAQRPQRTDDGAGVEQAAGRCAVGAGHARLGGDGQVGGDVGRQVVLAAALVGAELVPAAAVCSRGAGLALGAMARRGGGGQSGCSAPRAVGVAGACACMLVDVWPQAAVQQQSALTWRRTGRPQGCSGSPSGCCWRRQWSQTPSWRRRAQRARPCAGPAERGPCSGSPPPQRHS